MQLIGDLRPAEFSSSSSAWLDWLKERASELARDRLTWVEGASPRLTRPLTKSSSDSKSERSSNVGSPSGSWGLNSKDARDGIGALINDSPLGSNFCSSSSAGQSEVRAENSGARVGFAVPTVRFRGSQKSTSSEDTDRAYGDGEGERDGQEAMERRSLVLWWLAEANLFG